MRVQSPSLGLLLLLTAGSLQAANRTNTATTERPATTLLAAARSGDVETARGLLKNGADVNNAYGDGMTPLHWAATTGNVEMGKMMLYAGANVLARTRIGSHTPLMLAARSGSGPLVEAFLQVGADPRDRTGTGATALMFASAAGDLHSVQSLLDAGASPRAIEYRHGQTALMFAANAGRTDAVRVLLDQGAEPCASTTTVDTVSQERQMFGAYRARAKAASEAEAAEEKASGKTTADANGEAPSRASANELKGVDETATGKRKKRKRKGDKANAPRPKSFGQLVGKRGGMTALLYAARQGNTGSIEALVAGGADVNQTSEGDNTSPLLIATINGQFDAAIQLLEQGADPNLASDAGATPLYAAVNVQWAPHSFYPQPSPAKAATNHLDLMQALLDAGADVDARLDKKVWYTGFNFDQSGIDETGATAFWRAAQASDLSAMQLLAAAGADTSLGSLVVPERRSPNGRNADKDLAKDLPTLGSPAVNPLQVASGAGWVGNFHRNAPSGMMPVVRYLVEELDFDVNASDSKGYTPLHNAAARGDNAMIVYLVFHGARVQSVARSGETTADMANGPVQRIQPFPETLVLLEGMGSKNNDNCVSC